MRIAVACLAGFALVGCASKQPAATRPQTVTLPQTIYDTAVTAALVFEPPVTGGELPLDLSRAGREPSAFVSYEQTITSFYFLNFQDRQYLTPDRSSFRNAYIQTFGVSSR
jgi:hypothetical protein